MRATNLHYLTITKKKWSNVTLNHLFLQTAYSILFAFSPFFTVGHLSALSLTLILSFSGEFWILPLFHKVNVRIMDISDSLGEGGFIQWRSAWWQTFPPYQPEILQKNTKHLLWDCNLSMYWSYSNCVCTSPLSFLSVCQVFLKVSILYFKLQSKTLPIFLSPIKCSI